MLNQLRLLSFFNVVDGFSNALNFFSGVFWNADIELFFQFHHKLHCVERVRSQVVNKVSIASNFVFLYSQLLCDDVDNPLLNRCYVDTPKCVSVYAKSA